MEQTEVTAQWRAEDIDKTVRYGTPSLQQLQEYYNEVSDIRTKYPKLKVVTNRALDRIEEAIGPGAI